MKKILIVDDSFTVRKIIELLLKPLNFELIFAETGKDAISKGLSSDAQLVIIDYGLPDLKGTEVSKQIKSQKPYLPVLLMTSSKEEYPAMRMQEGQCDDVIEKPFDSQTFLSKIETLIKKVKDMPIKEEEVKLKKKEELIELTTPSEFPIEKEPFTDLNLGEEFTIETQAETELTVQDEKKSDILEEIIDDLEVIEELEELDEKEEIIEETPLETKIEDITLEELLSEESKGNELVETFEKEIEIPEVILEKEKIEIPEKEEEVKTETLVEEGKSINIDDFFADLNEILAEGKVSKSPEVEKEMVKPVIEEVVKDLKEIEMITTHVEETKEEEEVKEETKIMEEIKAKEEKEISEEDIWNFDLDLTSQKQAVLESKDTATSIDIKQIENIIRELTYDIVEKIAWEIVPEIVDSIMKDRFGKKN